MIITAKFSSTCPGCSAPVSAGTKVSWTKGSKARHLECAGKPTKSTRARRSALVDGDNEWRSERAMQAGMAFGCEGYNDEMGY